MVQMHPTGFKPVKPLPLVAATTSLDLPLTERTVPANKGLQAVIKENFTPAYHEQIVTDSRASTVPADQRVARRYANWRVTAVRTNLDGLDTSHFRLAFSVSSMWGTPGRSVGISIALKNGTHELFRNNVGSEFNIQGYGYECYAWIERTVDFFIANDVFAAMNICTVDVLQDSFYKCP